MQHCVCTNVHEVRVCASQASQQLRKRVYARATLCVGLHIGFTQALGDAAKCKHVLSRP